MSPLLWLVVLLSIGWSLVERRRLDARILALEDRVRRRETEFSPRSAPANRGAKTRMPVPPAGARPDRAQRSHEPSKPPARATRKVPDRRGARAVTALRVPSVNIPAVLGVVISLLGFSFLLKLAMDHGWLQLSIDTRHILVALTGAGFVAAGWRLRNGPASYSRALLGGGIATLCLTVYSATLVFDLIGRTPGFGCLLFIVGAAGTLASLLRSRTLAVLGLIGGLSAPLLLPDGEAGLPAVLAYYALFSAAALSLSLRHHWPALYALAFAGTYGSTAVWTLVYTTTPYLIFVKAKNYPAGWPSQLGIGALFALYVGIVLLGCLRGPGKRMTFVDRLLLLGTPAATLGLCAMIDSSGDALAVRALAIGVIYAACAALVRRVHGAGTIWMHAFVAVGVAFVTLAIPLGLEGVWITLAWAAGASLQIYLAMRQRLPRYALAALGLLGLGGLHHLARLAGAPPADGVGAYLHAAFIAGIWYAAAALLSAWWIDRYGKSAGLSASWRWVPFTLGVGAWLVTHGHEILRVIDGPERIAAFLALFSVTALLGDRSRWLMLRQLNALYAPALLAMLGLAAMVTGHPASAGGLAAWPLALAVLAWVLRSQPGASRDLALWSLHVVGLSVAAWELHYQLALRLDGAWPLATVTAMLAGWLAFAARRHGGEALYRERILITVAAAFTWLLFCLQLGDGSAAPLAFIPLLNPVDLATVAAMVALAMVLRLHDRTGTTAALLTVAGIGCGSMTVLRSVHHFADVPFTPAAMWSSMTAHTALTVTWAVAGLAAMVGGTLRVRREVWVAGAALMGVVVTKLFLVDLAGVNSAARIVSFLGVGGLLLAVGYLAPAPPRLCERI